MRVTIEVDSATPKEVYALTLSFQRTMDHLPIQATDQPTVRVLGTCMTWRSPAMRPEQVRSFWADFTRLPFTESHDVHTREDS